MIRWIVLFAGLLGMLAVMVGAYAAHGLEKSLTEQGVSAADVAKRLDQCDVAVRYHMTHVLALLVVGWHVPRSLAKTKRRSLAAIFMLMGIALFSGGLYSMVFLGEMGHWAIVPSGGLCFMLGWACVASLAFGRQIDPVERDHD